MKALKNPLASTKLEKVLYSIGDIGGNIVWSFMTSFLTLYYTDSVGLSAAFAGTMMLVCRFLDGLSDVAMGAVIDKTRARWGKARSWLLFSTIPLGLAFVAVFNVPTGLAASGKNVYAFITYFLLTVVCYTASNIAYHALLQRFSLTSQDRSVVSVVRTIFSVAAIMVINVVTPIALMSLGGEDKQRSWTILVLAFAALAVVCLFITFFGVKEKLSAEATDGGEKKTRTPLVPALKALLSNRYFYITISLFLTFYITSGSSGIGIYYARDVLGDANLYGILSIISVIPMFVIMPIVPPLFKKFGKRNTMIGGLLLGIAASLITLINPHNAALFIGMSVLRSAASMPLSVALFTFAGDIVDYNDMKSGMRTEGIATSANSIGQKLGTGLGAALLGWFLAWGKYDGMASVQPESAIQAMIFMGVVLPIIVFAIAVVLLLFWNLEKYQQQVQEYLSGKTNK